MVPVTENDSDEHSYGRGPNATSNEVDAVYANNFCIFILESTFRLGALLDSEQYTFNRSTGIRKSKSGGLIRRIVWE